MNDFEQVMEIITKEVMEQHEAVRQSGQCNMYDCGCVQMAADNFDFWELSMLDRDDYKMLLKNYTKLAEVYDIDQEQDYIAKLT